MICDLSQDHKGNVKPEEEWPTDEFVERSLEQMAWIRRRVRN